MRRESGVIYSWSGKTLLVERAFQIDAPPRQEPHRPRLRENVTPTLREPSLLPSVHMHFQAQLAALLVSLLFKVRCA